MYLQGQSTKEEVTNRDGTNRDGCDISPGEDDCDTEL